MALSLNFWAALFMHLTIRYIDTCTATPPKKFAERRGLLNKKMADVVPVADHDESGVAKSDDFIDKSKLWAEVFRSSVLASGGLHGPKPIFGNTPATIQSTAEDIRRAQERIKEREKSLLASKRTQVPPCYSIHPRGRFRQRWDIVNVMLIAYSAVAVPFHVCFNDSPGDGAVAFGYLVDAMFAMDIVFNFCTGIEVSDKSISFSQGEIAASYIKGWFMVDALSAFPWEQCWPEDDSSSLPQVIKVVKLSRLLRLLRLFRMLRITRIINRLEYSIYIQEGMRSIGSFAATLFLLTHWFSCIFYYLGDTNRDEEGFWAMSSPNDLHTAENIYKNYVAACVWTIMTLTTVGYGDVSSRTDGQRILSILAMITGALFFAYGVSHVVSIVDEVRADSKIFKKRMDRFNAYMAARNLPDVLKVPNIPWLQIAALSAGLVSLLLCWCLLFRVTSANSCTTFGNGKQQRLETRSFF